MPTIKQLWSASLSKGLQASLRIEASVGRSLPEDHETRIQQLSREVQYLKQANAELSKTTSRSNESPKVARRNSGKHGDGAIVVDGTVLPPRDARPCGSAHRDDERYLETADRAATWLIEKLGVKSGTSLLDVGCGPGRVAIGLTRQLGDDLSYHGVDVKDKWVRWAQRNITTDHPNYRFSHLDVKSDRYNPSGASLPREFSFPFPDSSFDFICLFSVFTHMMPDDVRVYLHDFRRILKPNGRLLTTAFLEDDVPEVEENPPNYKGRQWSGPPTLCTLRKSLLPAVT